MVVYQDAAKDESDNRAQSRVRRKQKKQGQKVKRTAPLAKGNKGPCQPPGTTAAETACKPEQHTGTLSRLAAYRYVLLSLLVLTIAGGLISHEFLLFRAVPMYKDIGSDTLTIKYPTWEQRAREKRPAWTFSYGMGKAEGAGILIPRQPLQLLKLFGQKFLYALGWIHLLEFVLGGAAFTWFLRLVGASRIAALCGGLFFACSGFSIVGAGWFQNWRAAQLAFLLLGFERFYLQRKWGMLVLAFVPLNPVYLFFYSLFLGFYATARFLWDHGPDWKRWGLMAVRIAAVGTLAVVLGMGQLWSGLNSMLNSPRGKGGFSHQERLQKTSAWTPVKKIERTNTVLSFFGNDLLGTGSAFRGHQNYFEAPLYYCGLLPLLLLPLALARARGRRLAALLLLLGVVALPVIFPYFRRAAWAFTGDYYRDFCYFAVVTVLVFAIPVLNNLDGLAKRREKIVLGAAFLALSGVLFFGFPQDQERILRSAQNLAFVFLLGHTVLLFLAGQQTFRRWALPGILLLVVVEVVAISYPSRNLRYMPEKGVPPADWKKSAIMSVEELKSRTGFNDYTHEALAFLGEQDQGFYRLNKDYNSGPAIHASLNDALAQGYYGTCAYSSFNQLNYIRFLLAIGVVREGNETDSRWAMGLVNVPLLHSFGSVKYHLSKRPALPAQLAHFYERIGRTEDVTIYRHKHPLPLGFCYDQVLSEAAYMALPLAQRQAVLYRTAVVRDDDVAEFATLATHDASDAAPYTLTNFQQDVALRGADAFEISKHGNTRIEGQIGLDKPRLLFFSIPFDAGWKVDVNGSQRSLHQVNVGFSGLLLEPGEHQIVLRYESSKHGPGKWVSRLGLLLFLGLFWYDRRKDAPGKIGELLAI